MTRAGEESSAARDAEALPRIDFSTLIVSLSHNGLVQLGDAPDPATGHPAPDLTLARQTLDLLGVLEEKTRGNLTGDEERILSAALLELRHRLAEVSQGR